MPQSCPFLSYLFSLVKQICLISNRIDDICKWEHKSILVGEKSPIDRRLTVRILLVSTLSLCINFLAFTASEAKVHPGQLFLLVGGGICSSLEPLNQIVSVGQKSHLEARALIEQYSKEGKECRISGEDDGIWLAAIDVVKDNILLDGLRFQIVSALGPDAKIWYAIVTDFAINELPV